MNGSGRESAWVAASPGETMRKPVKRPSCHRPAQTAGSARPARPLQRLPGLSPVTVSAAHRYHCQRLANDDWDHDLAHRWRS
jgi:hypothetical protein